MLDLYSQVFRVEKATCIRGSDNKTADHFEMCINTFNKITSSNVLIFFFNWNLYLSVQGV